MKKRLLGILLTLCVAVSFLPVPAAAANDGWPFVPSEKNMTNGKIKSGWAYIYSHDLGTFRVGDDGYVSPSRKTAAPFYFEHLGNDKYYIRAAYGGYLSYKDKIQQTAPIIISDTPCKWFLDAYNEGGVRRFALVTDGNHRFVIRTWGLCNENQDSRITLHDTLDGTANMADCRFTVSDWVDESSIPQWWKDRKAGKDAPGEGVGAPSAFGGVPAGLANTSREEWDVLRLTNVERARAGLTMLVTFDKMQKMAGVRSDELLKSYSHTRPNGKDCFTVFGENGFTETVGAENIAFGQGSPEAAVAAWMNSPGHKANILDKSLRYLGTGFGTDGVNMTWEQLFGDSKNSDCTGITYDEAGGYFTLTLKNGITAYAPYDPASSPIQNGQLYFNYPGKLSAAVTVTGAVPEDGWYNLRCMYNYLNLDSAGSAELRQKTENLALYAQDLGSNQITLKLADGRYLGVADSLKDGARVKAVSRPYVWNSYTENNSDIFSLRPADNTKLVMNASGEKKADGTHLILWTHADVDAPNHAEFRFIPAATPKTVSQAAKHPFTDVPKGAYYESPVVWALNAGVTKGTTETAFTPAATCTRGQVVTFLWRAKGSPEPASAANPFTDVSSGNYYYKAVLWAVEQGITNGSTPTAFNPGGTCTSGQVTTFLWRSNGTPSAPGTSALAAQYPGSYYTDAVAWAETAGLLTGTGAAFAPGNPSPRADIVTYLYRNAGSPAV